MQKSFLVDNPQPRLVPAYPYLLGVYLSDGHIYMDKNPKRGNYQFKLNTIDKDFAENVVKALEVTSGKKTPIFLRENHHSSFKGKPQWYLRHYGKEFCMKLKNDTANKSKLPKMVNWTREDKLALIAGIMDGDGYCQKGKPRGRTQYQVGITWKNIELDSLRRLMQSLGMKVGSIRHSEITDSIKKRMTINVRSFIDSGGYFTITRKQSRLIDYTRAPIGTTEGEDIVRTLWRHRELGRNDLAPERE